jgi:hypothetical protein
MSHLSPCRASAENHLDRRAAENIVALALAFAASLALTAVALAAHHTVPYGDSRIVVVEGAPFAAPATYRVLRINQTTTLRNLLSVVIPEQAEVQMVNADERHDPSAAVTAAWMLVFERGDPEVVAVAAAAVPKIQVPGNESGTSSGLIHALSVIDALTGGDLTAGRVLAGTGSVTRKGDVTEIASVEHKLRAAADAGAKIALVPSVQIDEALAVSPPGLEVVGVSSVADAVDALCTRGGISPLCR